MKKLLFAILAVTAFACGGGSKTENQEAGTEQSTEQNTDETLSPDTASTETQATDTTATDGGTPRQP
ncbi:hypothetical protein [Chryseosolibacter indicus]|uniref:Uncharacterized protein n=1 Tax=Chryseosolibacter indicus TaxID=2782351 RepID=A0ABS5VT91_9BACT|nr:hypothetical protein [Chryseosolibacter indicus]MBT1704649.1 hypothetical protein [Chryseosolibacter indicus]